MFRVSPGPIGHELCDFFLSDGIVSHNLAKIRVEDIEHLVRREMHVVQVLMIDKAIAPVGTMQFLNTLKLSVTIKKLKLGSIKVPVIVYLRPAICRDVNCGYVNFRIWVGNTVAKNGFIVLVHTARRDHGGQSR